MCIYNPADLFQGGEITRNSFEGTLWPLMRFFDRLLFGLNISSGGNRTISWAPTASFATGRASILLRPRELYRTLEYLFVQERGCLGSAWLWSNAFERGAWFDLFDPSLQLIRDVSRAYGMWAPDLLRSACARARLQEPRRKDSSHRSH